MHKSPYIKLYSIALVLAMLFCACSNTNGTISDVVTDSITHPPTESHHLSYETEFIGTEPNHTDPGKTDTAESLDVESGSFLKTYSSDETMDYLDYYLFIPDNATKNLPLVIFLHGDGEIGKPKILENYGIWGKMKEYYGNNFPFIGLSPCTRVATWTSDRVSLTLMELVAEIIEAYEIDPDRIIITGHSMGAIGVWSLISTYGDYFAGAVPVSCGTNDKLDYEMCSKVPILGIVGNSETLEYNFYKAMVKLTEEINESGGNAELMVLDGMTHEDTSRASFNQDAFDWILAQKRGN